MVRSFFLFAAIIFFFAGGVNHFISPQFYLPLIPPYFIYISTINWLAGIAEIIGAIGLSFKSLRKSASYGLILLMIAFVPSHIYFIQIGSCTAEGLCVPEWISWARLIIIHPLIIGWLYRLRDL